MLEEIQKARGLIMKHEGFKPRVYTDTTGHLTIGYGHNLQARDISENSGGVILDDDIAWFAPKLSQLLDFYDDLTPNRKAVLIDMAYNLGLQGLLDFKEMLQAIRKKNYNEAADQMLKSKWAEQVGQRAINDAYIMRNDSI